MMLTQLVAEVDWEAGLVHLAVKLTSRNSRELKGKGNGNI